MPFRTELGLDVLPVEGRVLRQAAPRRAAARPRRLLPTALRLVQGTVPGVQDVRLYQTVPLADLGPAGAALQTTADSSLWVALLLREGPPPTAAALDAARQTLAGRTLTLGVVPVHRSEDAAADVGSRARARRGAAGLPDAARLRRPAAAARLERAGRGLSVAGRPAVGQRARRARHRADRAPGSADEIGTWSNLEPAGGGRGGLPADPGGHQAQGPAGHLAAGPGRDRLAGRPPVGRHQRRDGVAARARSCSRCCPRAPVRPTSRCGSPRARSLPGTVTVVVTTAAGPQTWHEIDDLLAAGPEVPVRDPRLPPGTPTPPPRDSQVFALDAALGQVRFGDGARGTRPPRGARMRADYDVTRRVRAATSAPVRSAAHPTSRGPSASPTRCRPGAVPTPRRPPRPRSTQPASSSTATGWSRPRTSRRSCGARRASSSAASRCSPPSTRRSRRPPRLPAR